MTPAGTASEVGRLWRYGLLGIASNGLCYLAFLGLLWLRVAPVAANALCYALGLAISYAGNRRWTFRSENRHLPDLVRFGAAYGCGFAFSLLCMGRLVRLVSAPVAQLVTVGATAVVVFAALNLLRFGRPQRGGGGAARCG